MTERKSCPVRYMVVDAWYGYKVIDTLTPEGKTVKRFVQGLWGDALLKAHKCALYKNEAEGYAYCPKIK